MKRFFQKFWPIIFILGVWFIFSSPYFIQHKVPYPSTYQVSHFTPWNQYQELAGPVKNGSMPDIIDEIFPWKHFTIETLKKGQLPLWNPYSFAGTPHLANYQSAVFSPFNLLYFVLPFIDAWSIVVLLQPLLAGLFTYLLLRTFQVSKAGTLLASITSMFCGFMVIWMAYGTLSMAIAFLPLILFAIEKSFGKNPLWGYILLPSSLAISFFSGHFQISLYVTLYAFFYLLYKLITTKNVFLFLRTGLFFILGIIIASLQLIPTMELYKMSARSLSFSTAGAIPLQYLVTVFAPDFFGSPITRNDWMGYYNEWGSFIGIIPVFLAFLAILYRKGQKMILFFLFSGLITLLLAVDTPLQNVMASLKLPIFSTSIPSRLVVLFSFSFAVLAGFGFDMLLELIKKKAQKRILVPLSFFIVLLSALWLSLVLFKILPSDKLQIAVRNLVLPSAIFLIMCASVAASLFLKRKFFITMLVVILLSLATFDSYRFAAKWMPFDPRELVFPQMPVLSAAQKYIGNGRMYGDYLANVDTYYSLPGIQGYDPVFSKRYGEFLQSASSGEFVAAQRSVAALDKRGKYADRALDILGVTLIYHPYSDTDKPWAYPVWEKLDKYDLIYQDKKFQLFKNKTALPRAKVFYNFEVINDDKRLIKRIYDEKFDFRNVLLLEEAPSLAKSETLRLSSGQARKAKSKVTLDSYTPKKVIISITTNKPGLLFLSDSYYPKWKVKVNGKEGKIYRADYTFRAVAVPEGKSEAEFYYSLF